MGWASGGDVFDAVGNVVLIEVAYGRMSPQAAKAVNVALIKALQGHGWDTEGESRGAFDGYWYFDEAFEACGVMSEEGGNDD